VTCLSFTRKQDKLLAFIKERLAEGKVAPSYEEMAEHMGYASKGNVHRLLIGLEERGAIRRLPFRARAIEVLEGDMASVSSFRHRLLAVLSPLPGDKTYTVAAIRDWLRRAA
jgi:SOS-response transcriptional repressor LexA